MKRIEKFKLQRAAIEVLRRGEVMRAALRNCIANVTGAANVEFKQYGQPVVVVLPVMASPARMSRNIPRGAKSMRQKKCFAKEFNALVK